MDVFDWITETLKPETVTSDRFIYDDMDSLSDRSLPLIYQPFDASARAHWTDRGAAFDFLFSTQGRRLLDFGPGDGWPALIVAPFVDEVAGVDGSARRASVCTANARFVHCPPGAPLPFDDGVFDGVMAASSVEQTPDPQATLRELFRVLRPGGRLRMVYEALGPYRGGREREAWLWRIDAATCRLILFDRQIESACARQYGMTFAASAREVAAHFEAEEGALAFDQITVPRLEALRSAMTDARICTLRHPSGTTLVAWLHNIGFREVTPTHSGAWFAGQVFDQLTPADRPRDLSGVDALLRPLVQVVVQMTAPARDDPMITAVK